MFSSFNLFLIEEKVGINNDVVSLSEYIFSILQSNKNKYIITSDDVKTEKIIIDNIIINILNNKTGISGELNIKKSKITNKGLYTVINIYGTPNINTIYHELNHALQFFYKGKTETLKQVANLKSFNISGIDVILEKFIYLYYISESTEINSYIAESYIELKDILKNVKNINPKKFNFELVYKEFIRDTISYQHYEILKNYNIEKEFKKLKKVEVLAFFDLMKDQNIFFKKYYKKNLINLIKFIFKNFNYNDRINNYKLIDNVDEKYSVLIKKYNLRFKLKSEIILRKLSKLSAILKDEI